MSVELSLIYTSQPRESVQVTFEDGLVLEGPVKTCIEDFLHARARITNTPYSSSIMGGIVDGRLRELAYPIERDCRLAPLLFSDSDGRRIYRRTLVLLLTTAMDFILPDAQVNVGYAVSGGAFYCRIINRPPLTGDELARLEATMREWVANDEPVTKRIVSLAVAKRYFAARGNTDKIRLLETRERDQLTLYTLRGRSDYHFGYMLPRVGGLGQFRIYPTVEGFYLQYPVGDTTDTLPPFQSASKVTAVFEEAENWLTRMGVEDIGRLNRMVRTDQVRELILVAEALHEQKIAALATEIAERHQRSGMRVVMIAGPSSSGKTTFSKRLAIQLLAFGLRPFTLELDNYFVNRTDSPRHADGTYNFEALEALNLPLFNQHLAALVHGDRVQLPRFDFVAGLSLPGRAAQLSSNQIMLIEGIHGLNPGLVYALSPDELFRIYISPLTALNIDNHNRVPTTDVRLLRRLVRDAAQRGRDAKTTLDGWRSVREGEIRYIFPYQDNADAMFNSALVYELAALRPLAEPLLLQVEQGTLTHIEANRLLSFLRWVQPLQNGTSNLIPDTSLLREFIGGSILEDYHPADLQSTDAE